MMHSQKINKNEKKLADAKNEIKENEQKLTGWSG